MDSSDSRSAASSRLKSRKVLGMGGEHGHKSKIVRLLGLDDFITVYPPGFWLWQSASAILFIIIGFVSVLCPWISLSLLGEHREEGSNYMATRLYGATIAGMGVVDWITPASAYSLVLCVSLLRCSHFFFVSLALIVSFFADEVSQRVLWGIALNIALSAVSLFYLHQLKVVNSPRARSDSHND
ncbi:tumor protein p53-inducible protein 11-like [Oscarella lobularis]|uniref:tumor protein p53-inducible protein 11-like n=1 Tax=Oscarella lobularis TaxID=121494 RepID=UPI003313AAB1